MKSDKILVAITNFLVPIIATYAFFGLASYLNSGLFSFVSFVVLIFTIYFVKFFDFKTYSSSLKRALIVAGVLIMIGYLFALLYVVLANKPDGML